jgi:TolB-like protein/Flp pilus assembly protein TadD
MRESHYLNRPRLAAGGNAELSPESISAELAVILSSRTFRMANAQKNLLRFVVQETLENRAHLLKEYWIGVKVFHRGESFDPRMSSIVRLEARKLRANLARYFETEGAGDQLRIEIPKGGYAPVFRSNDQSPLLCVVTMDPLAKELHADGPEVLSWAVLPVVDRNHSREGRFFAEGLTDELSSALARDPHVRLAARSSASRLGGFDVREIGRILNVQRVLEGSVRRHGERFRVSLQASETASGYVLWSENFEVEAADEVRSQQEISLNALRSLRQWTSGDWYTSGTDNRFASGAARQPKDRRIALLQKSGATSLYDPHAYAAPRRLQPAREYADRVKSLVILAFCKSGSIFQLSSELKATASKALELDGASGEAHAAMAMALLCDYDWKHAEDRFRSAVQLAPNDPVVRFWYANYLMNTGRLEEAMAEHKTAVELNSDSAVAISCYGTALYFSKRFSEAIEHQRRALARSPDLTPARVTLGLSCIRKGSFLRGLTELERARALSNDAGLIRGHVGYTFALMGNRERANDILGSLLREYNEEDFRAFPIAEIYIGLGDKDLAFAWMHRVIDQKDWTICLKADPLFDPLRPDPRFATLLRRVNLH